MDTILNLVGGKYIAEQILNDSNQLSFHEKIKPVHEEMKKLNEWRSKNRTYNSSNRWGYQEEFYVTDKNFMYITFVIICKNKSQIHHDMHFKWLKK